MVFLMLAENQENFSGMMENGDYKEAEHIPVSLQMLLPTICHNESAGGQHLASAFWVPEELIVTTKFQG